MTLDEALLQLERQDKVINCKFKKIEIETDFLDTDESISLDYNLFWGKSINKYIFTTLLPQLDNMKVKEFLYFFDRNKVLPPYQCYTDKQLDLLWVLKECLTNYNTTWLANI